MISIQGAVQKQGRWLSYTNLKGRRVSISIDHIVLAFVDDNGPEYGITFSLSTDREVFLPLDVASMAEAQQMLEAILKEIQ